MNRSTTIGSFNPNDTDFFGTMVRPKRQRGCADDFDEHGTAYTVRFFVITSLERISRKAVKESESAGAFTRRRLRLRKEFVRDEDSIRSEHLNFPVVPQLIGSDPCFSGGIIDSAGCFGCETPSRRWRK